MKIKKLILTSLFAGLFVVSCSKDDAEEENVTRVNIAASIGLASEPNTNGEFTLTLSGSVSTATTISYTISGTATNGTDYQTISNSATIPANSTSKTIAVNIIDDTITEDDETLTITLTTTSNQNIILDSADTATVTITEAPEEFVLLPEEASLFMVNPNATPETIALFYNLKILSKTKFVVGQQDAFNSFYNDNGGESDIKKTTGSDPGLLGSDFMFITDDNNDGSASNWFYQQEEIIKYDAIEAYNKGMINTFCWHMREPYEGCLLYTSPSPRDRG